MFECDQCEHTFNSKVNLSNHKLTNHKLLKVDLPLEDQIQLSCNECDFKAYLNIQLKNHKKKVHDVEKQADLKYKCEICQYSSGFLIHLWKHRLVNHPQNIPNFHPRSKDMVAALLAEQNMDILDEIETLKKDFKGAFIAEHIEAFMEVIVKEIKESSKKKVSEVTEHVGTESVANYEKKHSPTRTPRGKIKNVQMENRDTEDIKANDK